MKPEKPVSVLHQVERLLVCLANFLLYMMYITIFHMYLQPYYGGFLHLLSLKVVRTTECLPQNGVQQRLRPTITIFQVIGEHVLIEMHACNKIKGNLYIGFYRFISCIRNMLFVNSFYIKNELENILLIFIGRV